MLFPSVCTSRPALRYGPPTVLRDVRGWTVLRQTATAVPGHPASDAPYFLFFTWTYLCVRVGFVFSSVRLYVHQHGGLLPFVAYTLSHLPAPFCHPGVQRTFPDRVCARHSHSDPPVQLSAPFESGFWVHSLRRHPRSYASAHLRFLTLSAGTAHQGICSLGPVGAQELRHVRLVPPAPPLRLSRSEASDFRV